MVVLECSIAVYITLKSRINSKLGLLIITLENFYYTSPVKLITMPSVTDSDLLAAEGTKIEDSESITESRDHSASASPSLSFTGRQVNPPTTLAEEDDPPKQSSPWAGIHANIGSYDHIDAGRTFPKLSIPVELMRYEYDVVVVGSGYGGGVAASRMARGGQSVCLLELGKEKWGK